MKYVVMECRSAYAVLMDEESRFVFAANKGYEIGQTVINPVIMSEYKNQGRNITAVIKVLSAAAACVALITGVGYSYYAHNLKTYSVVTITSDSAISMELNKTGKVIRIKSDTDYGKEIIDKTDVKGMDKLTAANEILQTEISDGHISNGDTVDVYVTGSNSADTDSLRTELENELPKLDLKVNIHEGKAEKHDKIKPHEKDKEAPLPEKDNIGVNKDKNNDKTPAPPVTTTAKHDDKVKPAVSTPVGIPEPPAKEEKDKETHDENHVHEGVVPPAVETPVIGGDKPEPPLFPDKIEPFDKGADVENPLPPHHQREHENKTEAGIKEQAHKEAPKTDMVKKEDMKNGDI